MINQEELNISNKSYVNKDFQKLYPEILELAKQLSSRWDPSTSNESDPGVVLLKLLAFMGDKINYNIDKNILEAFMPSATQESSMRNLCEINGYFPRYFRSATVDVSFLYSGNKLTDSSQSFTLRALETTITDVDTSITYTLLDDVTIFSRFSTVTVSAIEGKLDTLVVNNVQDIHLSNLDDNNRIYFPERQVAENGVFIQKTTDTGNFWSKVDNLNTVEPGKLVYKFGFDSIKNLPYLEFPSDISGIIDDGLFIRYIRTSGANGNVRTGFLTRLSSPAEIFLTDDTNIRVFPDTNADQSEQGVLRISNLKDSNNGQDPESIDEAYNSFKKVVGTFDTLVTSRDYANAIYNLLTSDSKNVVSNIQVSDRRTDINYSNQILSFNEFGPVKLNTTSTDDITAFNLCLYPLNPITTSFNLSTYQNSFLPLTDLTDVTTGIEEYKTISHDYKTLLNSDIYLYKNYYKLNVKISTNYKVNTFEQNSILANINNALFTQFNSREIDYGYEIPFDSLLKVIQRADARIKNVSLEEPELYTKVMTTDRTETLLLDPENKTPYLNLITKNILAGRVPLFAFKDDFDFEFGQTSVNLNTEESSEESDFIHEKLIKLTTEVTIPNSSVTGSSGYVLKDNEYIQAIAPSLATEVIYPAFINYRWKGLNLLDIVPENQEHVISGTQSLIVNYADSNGTSIAIEYTADKIITYRVSREREFGEDGFEDFYVSTIVSEVTVPVNIIKPVGLTLREPADFSISGVVITKKIKFGADILSFYSLGTEESIEKRKYVQTTLTSTSLPCYWIMNNSENALFTESDEIYDGLTLIGYERILGENEYFIYSNTSLTELEVLGSGTRITLNTTVPENLTRWRIIPNDDENIIEITEVSEKGLNAFAGYNWQYFNFNQTSYNLKIEEMSILTLSTGDSIRIISNISEAENFGDFTNSWVDVSNDWEIIFTTEGETKSLPFFSDSPWKVRSRLDLNSGPNLKQKILTNQTITLVMSDGTPTGEKTRIFNNDNNNLNSYIMFNVLLQRAGGENLDLKVTYLSGETSFDVTAYTFDFVEPTYVETTTSGDRTINIDRQPSGYIQIPLKNLKTSGSENIAEIELPIVSYYDSGDRISENGATELLMIYWNHSTTGSTTITLNSDEEGIRKYNVGDSFSNTLELTTGINVIEINSVSLLTLSVGEPGTGTDVLQLGKISVTSGYNPATNLTVAEFEGTGGILSIINNLDSNNLFFYNGALDSFSLIEFNDLSDARALFDFNNLANRFTLSQIDFEGSRIEIARTSRI